MAAGEVLCLETQKKEIDNLLKLSLKKGDTWYLIDTKWFRQWKKYVGYDTWDSDSVGEESANPGPIDNKNLFKENTLTEGQALKLKEHMIDDIDYILVPEEAWNKLLGWYGLTEGQETITRKVIHHGLSVRHCKVEVYYLDLKLCENSQPDNQILKQFSHTDTIGHLEKEMRRTFNISEIKEVRLWNRYTTNTYEQLTKPEHTLQDSGLYQGQVIAIEVKNDDGTWPRQAKSARWYSSSVSLRATPEQAIQQIKVIPSQSETAKAPSSIPASSINQAESSVPEASSVTAVASGTSDISSSDHQFLSSRSDIQPCLISEKQPLSEQLAEELTHAQQMETLSEILTKLESRIVTSRKNIVNVHRENVLDGGFRAFGRKSFDSWCELHVRFSGEAGIDTGGPQREFMRLALKAIKTLPIFGGPDNEKILVYDQKCLAESAYYKAGQMIAYFIVHRGPCPNFVSPTLYIALAEGIASMQPTPDEILDDDLREQVKAIADASNEKDFKIAVFKAVDLINLAGCTNLTLQFTSERQKTLVKSLTKFVVCDRILGPFEQFEKGLQTLGLVDEIRKNKEQWREVFIFSTKPLCALQMDSLFTVKWSAEGSKRKHTEERILVFWRDFLQDLEEGEGGMSLTLKDLLAFTTGAEEVPPLGFLFQPKLSFIHPEDLMDEAQLCSAGFPYANTSYMELKIPVLDDYDTFQKNIATAISKAATLKNH